ncbi:MAG: hypothetical protein ACLFQK_06620 [Fibrobacterota bacterium]
MQTGDLSRINTLIQAARMRNGMAVNGPKKSAASEPVKAGPGRGKYKTKLINNFSASSLKAETLPRRSSLGNYLDLRA